MECRRQLQGQRRFTGKRPSFSPKSISGLVAWYRADKGITIGTGVSAWADQSGANNATQATGTQQPTLNASDAAYNNKPTLSFSAAASQFLATGAGLALAQPYTILFVGNDDGTAAPQIFTSDKAASVFNCGNRGTGVYYATGGADVISTQAVSSVPRIYISTINGASTTLRFSAATPNVTGNIVSGSLTGLAIGCAGNGSTFFLNGKCAEVLVYNSALSASAVASLNTYLGARYNIAVAT